MTVFDWIQALSECSLGAIFEKLKMDLRTDVENAQSRRAVVLAGVPPHYGFRLVDGTFGREIAVMVQGNGIHDSVTFRLGKDSIDVFEGDVLKFSAKPTLNNKGECRLLVNGEEQELWYVRKLALESLFFKAY